MYNTGNPVPSSALEDMADNAQTFDALVTKTEGTTTDRLGRTRRVFQQILMDMGFQPLAGSFQTGATITARNQTLYDEVSHVFYAWGGTIPVGGYVVPVGSNPTTAGGTGVGAWSDKTDLTIRGELASDAGSNQVYFKLSSVAKAIAISKLMGQIVYADNFDNVDPSGTTDSTSGIQAAINYAETLVKTDTFTTGQSDKIGGATVVLNGAYKVTDSLRVSKSNVRIEGLGGTSIHPYFTGTSGYKPVFIIGTAELWQTGNDITNTTKYNAVNGLLIKWPNGSDGFIGILSSGTRNMEVSNTLVERGFCGLYMENTSELYSKEFASTGCTYSVIGDNRGNRSAANSPLGVACTDNDVSSNVIDMLTSYYSQHTGVLLLNTGTTIVNGTIGVFSDNPTAPASVKLGLPSRYAGVHVTGSGDKWTRGGSLHGIVFEAKQTVSRDCIVVESNTNCPIISYVVDKCHVQTYAADHDGGNVTTFLRAISNNSVPLGVSLRDCGFTPSSSGYMYGHLFKTQGDSVNILVDNCYPASTLATSAGSRKVKVRDVTIFDSANHATFPPTGWTTETTGSGSGAVTGVTGQQSFTRLTGNTTIPGYLYKGISFREHTLDLGAVYCSFLAKGNATTPIAYTVINAQSDSASNVVSPTNSGRYSNQNYHQQNIVLSETEWKRFYMVFNPFDTGYAFDEVRVVFARGAGLATEYLDLAEIEVGYISTYSGEYNPF